MFPVEVAYLKEPCSDYAAQAVQTVWDIHLKVRELFQESSDLIHRNQQGMFWCFSRDEMR